MRANAATALGIHPAHEEETMQDTVDERVTQAREYLAGARQRDINYLPPSRMQAELAETRHQLGQVLAVLAEQQDGARQLAEVRQLLADFDWEFQDRQYALEAIERIVSPGPVLDSELWTCRGCGGQMVGRRPADDRCRYCAPGGAR
jgi:hypothetical protein